MMPTSTTKTDCLITTTLAGVQSSHVTVRILPIMAYRILPNISRDPEWLWLLPFDNKFLPENPFVELFSNVGGKYLLQPSQQVQDMWNSQTQTNNFNFDARGKNVLQNS